MSLLRFFFRHTAYYVVTIVFWVGLGLTSLKAQTKAIDSLKKSFQNASNDSLRVDLLEKIGYEYLYFKPDSALYYIDKSYDLSQEINYKLGTAKAYNRKGTYYVVHSKYTQAIEEFQKAIQLYRDLNNELGLSESYGNLGVLDFYLRDYDSALENFSKAIVYLDTLNQEHTYTKYITNLSGVHREKKNLDSALYYAQKSLDNSLGLNDQRLLAVAYFNLGTAQYYLKNYELAVESLEESLARETIPLQFRILARSYKSLSHTELKELTAAEKELNDLEVQALDTKDQYVILRFYEAKQELLDAQNRNGEALDYAKRYISLNNEIHNREQTNILQNIKIKYETEEQIYENRLLRNEADMQNMQLRNQRYAIWAVAILTFLLLILIIILYRMYNLKSEKNRILRENQEVLNKNNRSLELINTQKDNLFSIVAHDVRSPIASILNSTAFLNSNFTSFSSEEIKYLLEQLHNQTHTLHNLIEGVLVWAKSQMNGFNFQPQEIQIDELVTEIIKTEELAIERKKLQILKNENLNQMVVSDKQVMQVIMRNFLTNAIKFTPAGGTIHFEFNSDNGQHRISVKDTGIGMSREDIRKVMEDPQRYSIKGTEDEPGNGIGLILCKEIALKTGGRIEVNSTPGAGSSFTYVFPQSQRADLS